MKPVIAITMGDFNGIGPEVALKAANSHLVRRIAIPVLVGSLDVFEYYAKLYKMKISIREVDPEYFGVEDIPRSNSDDIPLIVVRKFQKPKIKLGKISFEAGRLAVESIITAAVLNLKYGIDGIVTAPISKAAVNFNGLHFPGQTELLAAIYKTEKYAMILACDNFRVGLATIHIPISQVASSITTKLVAEKISTLNNSMKIDFGIKKPKIAVLGLNPHAGENGLLGNEEKTTILPAMKLAKQDGANVSGPFPADGFFGISSYKNFDAILTMYHDQGLIPLKIVGFNKGVNFTAGLPVVRTSPDHGTAFSIAGKGIADPSSTIEAVRLAVEVIKNRNQHIPKKTIRKK